MGRLNSSGNNRACNFYAQVLLCLLFTSVTSLPQDARLAQIIQAQRLQFHRSCYIIAGPYKQTQELGSTKIPNGYRTLRIYNRFIHVKLYPRRKTWADAQTTCQEDGGSLVKFDSMLTERRIVSYFGFAAVKRLLPWIGLKDAFDNNTYFWTDGTRTTHKNWLAMNPSFTCDGRQENCVNICCEHKTGLAWNDQFCWKNESFICQI